MNGLPEPRRATHPGAQHLSPKPHTYHLPLMGDPSLGRASRTLLHRSMAGVLLSGQCIAVPLLSVHVIDQPDADNGDAADAS